MRMSGYNRSESVVILNDIIRQGTLVSELKSLLERHLNVDRARSLLIFQYFYFPYLFPSAELKKKVCSRRYFWMPIFLTAALRLGKEVVYILIELGFVKQRVSRTYEYVFLFLTLDNIQLVSLWKFSKEYRCSPRGIQEGRESCAG